MADRVVLRVALPQSICSFPALWPGSRREHRDRQWTLLPTGTASVAWVEVPDPAGGTRWHVRHDERLAPHQAAVGSGRPDAVTAL